jgi:1,4-alpha-glucan branching enzyme
VEKVNPDLVARDEKRQIYTVRYDAVNAMLLNEFLKEHRKAQEQEARLTKQEETKAQQQRQIEALTAGLQKVSNRLEASKAAPHLVATLEITNRAASSHCL